MNRGLSPEDLDGWSSFLVNVALEDPDADVRSEALSLLRTPEGAWLPSSIEEQFLDVLATGEPLQRYRAVWPLTYVRTDRTQRTLIRTLQNDEAAAVRLRALEVLWFHDQEQFPDHVVVFIKGLVEEAEDMDTQNMFADTVAKLTIQGEQAVPYLLEGLRDPDAGVRQAAAFSARDFTGEAAKVVLSGVKEVGAEQPKMRWVAKKLQAHLAGEPFIP